MHFCKHPAFRIIGSRQRDAVVRRIIARPIDGCSFENRAAAHVYFICKLCVCLCIGICRLNRAPKVTVHRIIQPCIRERIIILRSAGYNLGVFADIYKSILINVIITGRCTGPNQNRRAVSLYLIFVFVFIGGINDVFRLNIYAVSLNRRVRFHVHDCVCCLGVLSGIDDSPHGSVGSNTAAIFFRRGIDRIMLGRIDGHSPGLPVARNSGVGVIFKIVVAFGAGAGGNEVHAEIIGAGIRIRKPCRHHIQILDMTASGRNRYAILGIGDRVYPVHGNFYDRSANVLRLRFAACVIFRFNGQVHIGRFIFRVRIRFFCINFVAHIHGCAGHRFGCGVFSCSPQPKSADAKTELVHPGSGILSIFIAYIGTKSNIFRIKPIAVTNEYRSTGFCQRGRIRYHRID